MSSAKIQWIGGGKFVGTDSTNHSVVLSTASEGIGMKPSELMLVALASCTAVDVVDILAKKRMPLCSLEIRADANQDADPPWTFRKIHLTYLLKGKGLTDKAVLQAIELSEEKYCSVAATLRGVAEITYSFEIQPEEKPKYPLNVSFFSASLEVREMPQKGHFAVFASLDIPNGEILAVWGGQIVHRDEFEGLPRNYRHSAYKSKMNSS